MRFSKYTKIASVAIQSQFEYRFNYLTNFLITIIPFSINLLLWFAIYNNNSTKFGYKIQEMISYYILVLVVSNIIPNNFYWRIAYEIKMGDINKYLIKPFNFMAYQFFTSLATCVNFITLGIIPIAVIAFFLRNYLVISISGRNIIYFLLAIGIGFTIEFFLVFLLSLTSFFFSEITALFAAIGVLQGIVSGKFFPLSIIPKQIYEILVLTPFQFTGYFPSIILLNRLPEVEIIKNLILGFGWIITLFIFSKLVWKAGLNKYSAFGG